MTLRHCRLFSLCLVPLICLALAVPVHAAGPQAVSESDEPASELQPTHEHSSLIKVGPGPLHTFCLDGSGNILAGVGSTSGEIRVLDPDGELLSTWKLPVIPEAINVGSDGHVYVGGDGQVLKLNSNGKVLLQKQAPHTEALLANKDALRKTVAQQFAARSQLYARQVDLFEARIKTLEAKGDDLSDIEKRQLQAYKRSIELFQKQVTSKEPTEEEIDLQVDRMRKSKTKFSSIGAHDGYVFIACPASVGYGFDVWRTNDRFEAGEVLVSGLRGCCGQMDVQCCQNGLYVAENSRHRVCRYDHDGEMVKTWGERNREGLIGFGSCCNPMNLTFGPNGDVYTAESTTGRIKRFSASGELLALVGNVKLVPGCKKVSIAVNKDGSRVYMLDITRTHIVMMQQVAADES